MKWWWEVTLQCSDTPPPISNAQIALLSSAIDPCSRYHKVLRLLGDPGPELMGLSHSPRFRHSQNQAQKNSRPEGKDKTNMQLQLVRHMINCGSQSVFLEKLWTGNDKRDEIGGGVSENTSWMGEIEETGQPRENSQISRYCPSQLSP